MPRISVVVPIYNVEAYLLPCLESLAAQTVSDFEAIMVDDGSADRSAAIAQEFAARDPRFRLVTQENGGLSKARNTGLEHVQGEFLAFLDSDDLLPPNAYELLLTALDETGSDFATGNVHRLTRFGTNQAPFLAKTFARTRLKTHITDFRALLADRTAWNKLWRREFWGDRRFPEGRVHEDIPIILPAHFKARSVDVIADPVYLYRIREGADLSITQRRLEPKVLIDRMTAIETVTGFLAREGPRGAKRWYDESVVADDLKLHLNILDSADDAYIQLFYDRVNAFLDGADKRVFDHLVAIDRLKWHLVRRRMTPELMEVLRFEKEELFDTPPVQDGGKWYGDYPFRADREKHIPSDVYRLDQELQLRAHLEDLRRDGDQLKIRGYAYIHGIGAPEKLTLVALRPGRLRRVRLRLTAKRIPTTLVQRPDVTAESRQAFRDLAGSGFEATVDPKRFGKGVWELYAYARAGGIRRRRSRFTVETPPQPISAVDLPGGKTAVTSWGGRLTIETRPLTLREARLDGDAIVLSGEPAAGKPRLELTPRSESRALRFPLEATDTGFTARVPLKKLRGAEVAWEMWAIEGDARVPITLPEDAPGETWRDDSREGPPGEAAPGEPPREIALFRSRQGVAALIERATPPIVTGARWDGDELVLTGTLPPHVPCDALVLLDEDRGDEYAFAVERDGDRFTARATPTRVESLAGTLPLAEGSWHLYARPGGQPVIASLEGLPLATTVAHKPFTLGVTRHDQAVLIVRRDLDPDERGPYHQRRLAQTAYAPRRSERLQDTVVYTSFGGRQYSDSPRAIHEELVRRGAPLEHLWVVRDARYAPPPGTAALREGSREYHEALARARFVVANDHFPEWFERRPEQVCVQTWHGTPLKRLGLDVSESRKTFRRFQRGWHRQVANWQYVISPNRFSTPILRRAYAIEGEMLETGYPRVDVLARPDRDALSVRLRERLGIPAGVRTVLYAPTYRDHVADRRGRYRLDLQLDVERLRAALGDDTVILFRKHHYVADAAPPNVFDVSAYPDGTELMLAADVLLTDYSSMMVDYANTGRPMLFYTYDLDAYQDEIRGFYLDFVGTVPGPLLGTTDEVIEALRDLDAMRAQYSERYDAFRAQFCELDDGQASARVVDRVFAEALAPVAT